MAYETWRAFYQSDWQAVYALLVVPAAFLAWWLAHAPRRLAADPPTARFVRLYAAVFAVETLIDPVATGPLVRALALGEGGATALGLTFVLLGDFRVYLLVFAVAAPGRPLRASILEAAAWTPLVAIAGFALHRAIGGADQLLWMLHELCFVAVCGALLAIVRRRLPDAAPDRARLARAIGFVALYYGLWAGADALILFGGSDRGWALRVVPNQLYYAFWVPFVYWTFFDARGDARR